MFMCIEMRLIIMCIWTALPLLDNLILSLIADYIEHAKKQQFCSEIDRIELLSYQ